MNTLEMMSKLSHSSIVHSEVSLEMQLGLPLLENVGDVLAVRLLPHKEVLASDEMLFFPHQYELVWAYPFEHVIEFKNISLGKDSTILDPVASVSVEKMLTVGKYGMYELYAEYDKVLRLLDAGDKLSDAMLLRCQAVYFELVASLGLQTLYGSAKGGL